MSARLHNHPNASLRQRPPVHQRESLTGDPYRLDDGIPVLTERLHKIDTEALPGGQGLAIGATALPRQESDAHRERARRAINAKPEPMGPTLGQAMFASGCVAIAILALAVAYLPGFALKALAFLGGLFGATAA
jgi:hypothetical protein